MGNNKETRTVPLYQLKEIANTLRMVANTLKSPERETCLDRNVMRSWNDVVDIINYHEPSPSEALSYYMRPGQIPVINE